MITIRKFFTVALLALVAFGGQALAQNRIIALNGDITEFIYALGAEDQLVAVDATSNYPAEVSEVANIGYAGRLSAEALLAYEPTIIIANDLAQPAEVLEQVAAAGVEIIMTSSELSLETPFVNLRQVAEIVGKEKRGEELAVELQAKIDEAAAAGEALSFVPRVMFLYLGSSQMQFAGGVDVPSHTMITAAGAIDAGAEAGFVGYQPFTPEALVTAAPDVLLITDRGVNVIGSLDGVLAIPGVMQTPAGLAGNIIVFEDNYLLSLGLRTGDALLDLVRELENLN